MPAKRTNKLLTQLLNLPGVLVKDCQQVQGVGVILYIEAESQQAICPRCGRKSQKLHQNHQYLVKDLPLFNQPTYLRVNRRQFKCQDCQKPFSEDLLYVKKKRNYTQRLARKVLKQVIDSELKSVAENNELSQEEIQTILQDIGKTLGKEKPRGIKRIGLDEIALVKGQGNYCAVIVDLDSKKLLAIVESRSQCELRKILESWGEELLNQIEEVSIDLWKPYKTLVKDLMQNAQVVADRFHVMKLVNEELDRQRKVEKKSAESLKNKREKSRRLEALKKSKYALLKNEKDLNGLQKEKLKEVKEVIPKLAVMHQIKEELRKIFESATDWGTGLFKLLDWLKEAAVVLPESYKTIVRWFGEIISYFDHRTTNGVVEGINNKLKLKKRLAYGFRNFDNFRVRSLLDWHFNY